MKITVVGIGYVGLSVSCLLAQQHQVTALDIDQVKVGKLNRGCSPLEDREIISFLSSGTLKLKATTNADEAFADPDFVVIATLRLGLWNTARDMPQGAPG